jgi:hypothetical protein
MLQELDDAARTSPLGALRATIDAHGTEQGVRNRPRGGSSAPSVGPRRVRDHAPVLGRRADSTCREVIVDEMANASVRAEIPRWRPPSGGAFEDGGEVSWVEEVGG